MYCIEKFTTRTQLIYMRWALNFDVTYFRPTPYYSATPLLTNLTRKKTSSFDKTLYRYQCHCSIFCLLLLIVYILISSLTYTFSSIRTFWLRLECDHFPTIFSLLIDVLNIWISVAKVTGIHLLLKQKKFCFLHFSLDICS